MSFLSKKFGSTAPGIASQVVVLVLIGVAIALYLNQGLSFANHVVIIALGSVLFSSILSDSLTNQNFCRFTFYAAPFFGTLFGAITIAIGIQIDHYLFELPHVTIVWALFACGLPVLFSLGSIWMKLNDE